MSVGSIVADLRPEQAGAGALLAADVPWRLRELTRTLRTLVFATIVLVAGWVGASGTPLVSRQLAWAAVSVTGLIIAGLGMVSWLLGGLRVIHQVSEEALAPLCAEYSMSTFDDGGATALPSANEKRASGSLVTAPGMTRSHELSCLLVRGKSTRVVRVDDTDLRPCGVCQP
ncbi:MAG: hypothetical protein QOJ67_3224 [Acidimicrobiaceae bacterium]|jgi:hypothetical protein